MCALLTLLRITSWRLGRRMVGHGRMFGLISFSLVRRFDSVYCQFFMMYSVMKYLESCSVCEHRARECEDEIDCLAHVSANSFPCIPIWLGIHIRMIVCALVWRYDIWFCIFCDILLGRLEEVFDACECAKWIAIIMDFLIVSCYINIVNILGPLKIKFWRVPVFRVFLFFCYKIYGPYQYSDNHRNTIDQS